MSEWPFIGQMESNDLDLKKVNYLNLIDTGLDWLLSQFETINLFLLAENCFHPVDGNNVLANNKMQYNLGRVPSRMLAKL